MKRWFKYIKPYLPFFIIGPVCMIVEVIGEIFMPKFLSMIIDYGYYNKEATGFVKAITDITGPGRNFILAIMGLMILTAIMMMVGGIGGAYFGAKASVNFAADLRSDVYKCVQKFSFSSIDKFSTGSLVTRLTNDVTQMQNFVNMLLRMALRSPGMLIGAFIMSLTINPKLTSIIAVSIVILITCIIIIIGKGFSRFSAMQTKIDNLNTVAQENITNVRVVKSFVREDYETKKFAEANADLKKTSFRAMSLMIFMSPIMTILMNLTSVAILWFGGNMVVNSSMTAGDLSAFITYVTQILSSLMMVTMLFINLSRALASGKRIVEVLDEKTDISDENARCKNTTVEKGDIEFRNVSFRYYKTSEEKVLSDISFKINAGETVGIIGSTGCGKSTLVSMIPRLYDADEGEVLVDGVNVKDYSLYNLREGIGMVLQKNLLFSGTIKDNLLWGNDTATEEEIIKAAEHAQADKFVTEFEKGYDHDIDQGGTNVSGGQKQRLCIARALLKKPKILILDDSTSAVDTATEARIRSAFRSELNESTKIIIAQRISSVIDADKIIVMNNGVITGIGTHDKLINSNTEYQEIYYSQTEKPEVNE
ncbi:MAG: ABC transporter ATP-binding protein [Clostridia bacterium]|nr:ABC transporter ATP-binding protein [Clostridia bacterium]